MRYWRAHLRGRTLVDVVRESETTQEGLDPEAFSDELSRTLRDGAFQFALVLDDAPDELATLVGLLESIAAILTVDLVTVTAYELDGRRIVVPQLVTPSLCAESARTSSRTSGADGLPVEAA